MRFGIRLFVRFWLLGVFFSLSLSLPLFLSFLLFYDESVIEGQEVWR